MRHGLQRPLRIAVDAGALAGPRDGIGRYLRSLFPRLVRQGGDVLEWHAYGRAARSLDALGIGRIHSHADGLPAGAGRVIALATSMPWWLRRHRPDLLWAPAHRLPWGIPASTARVVTIHDLCWAEAPHTMRPATRWLDRALMPRSLLRADRIIAVSSATRAALVARYPALAQRVVVVREAAEPLPPPQERSALSSLGITSPFVLFVGSMEPRKNLARLLQAFASLPPALRDRHALVVAGGRGWGGVDVEATARTLGIADRVRVLGVVDDALLATLYAHARCLAMPSLYEGFGLPLLEALSLGTPVLHGDNSSMPEVAGDAGLGIDASSVEAVASGLTRLLADDALHARLASRARAHAARFSWESAARETMAVFEDALAARQALSA